MSSVVGLSTYILDSGLQAFDFGQRLVNCILLRRTILRIVQLLYPSIFREQLSRKYDKLDSH